MTTGITEIDPADFGGAVAHVAAAQVFEFLTASENVEGTAAVNWYGSEAAGEDLQADVLAMARYINGRPVAGEQVWRWMLIQRIAPARIQSGRFDDLPMASRMAFDLFAAICATAHDKMDVLQIEARKREHYAAAEEAQSGQGLKFEDSIFEQHGSLADQEPHQKQFLEDQKRLDRERAEREGLEELDRQSGGGEPAASAGTPIDDQAAQKPAGISIGTKEGEGHEKGGADQGQEAGSEGGADPGAQGSLHGLPDGGPALHDAAAQAAGEPPAAPDPAGEDAAALADGGAGTLGGADGSAGAEPVKATSTASTKRRKPAKGKSST